MKTNKELPTFKVTKDGEIKSINLSDNSIIPDYLTRNTELKKMEYQKSIFEFKSKSELELYQGLTLEDKITAAKLDVLNKLKENEPSASDIEDTSELYIKIQYFYN
jgi:hypothetical protein